MLLFLLFLQLLFLVAAVFFVLSLVLTQIRMLRGEPPFVPIERGALEVIVNHPNFPQKGAVVYDLGCGDARFLVECFRKYPGNTYIGIEKNLFPSLLAAFRLWRAGNPPNIQILRKDMFLETYEKADLIYAYLFPKTLATLSEKFKRELKENTLVITPTFLLPTSIRPIFTLPVPKKKYRIISDIHFYKF